MRGVGRALPEAELAICGVLGTNGRVRESQRSMTQARQTNSFGAESEKGMSTENKSSSTKIAARCIPYKWHD
jgi:hypothetical protein